MRNLIKYGFLTFLCVVLSVFALVLPVKAGDANVGDSAGNASDYSFDTFASTASAALSTAFADPTSASALLSGAYGTVTPESAGGLLGYTDKENTLGVFGFFLSQLSLGSNTKEYKSLSDGLVDKIGTTSGHNSVFADYVATGAVFNDMGIDKTGSAVETVGLMSKRGMIGGTTIAAFVLSQSVAVVFKGIITILKLFNPFALFSNIATTTAGAWRDKIVNASLSASGGRGILFGSDIAKMIGKIYDGLFYAGSFILVIMFGVMIFRFFFSKPGNRLSGLRAWVTRGLFIFGGIAILGGTYTTVLDQLSDLTSGPNTAAAKMIASTFCDFEGYAVLGLPRLSTPVKVNVRNGAIKSDDSNDVQKICYAVNSVAIRTASGSLPSALTTGTGSTSTERLVTGMQQDIAGSGTSNIMTDATTKWVFDMLLRYQTGKKIYSSSYESLWKSKNWGIGTSMDDASTAMATVAREFLASPTVFNDQLQSGGDYATSFTTQQSGKMWTPSSVSKQAKNPFSGGSGCALKGFHNGAPTGSTGFDLSADSSSAIEVKLGAWSAMAVYNYLNTTFSDSSLITYSAANSASNFVRDSHYSVNLVGTGMGALVYYLVCITLLITYSVLGFVYGFGIIITNIKRGLRLIIAVPGAMLGSLQAIARVISYTVLMIAEIVINIMMYMLTTELLYIFATTVTQTAASIIGGFGIISQIYVTYMLGFIVVGALIWFTIQCLKLKKPITKALEEMADNVIQKFIVGGNVAQASVNGARGSNGAAGSAGYAAGALAGAHQPAKGIENFINPVGSAIKNADAKHHAHKAKSEAEGNKMLADMGVVGGSASAVEDERNSESYSAMRKKAKRDAQKAKINGGAKAVVGAAEVAAGYATGNVALGMKGTQNLENGASDMKNADINKTNDFAAAANTAANASGGQNSIAAEVAQSNNANISKLDLKNEAASAAGAALGGMALADGGAITSEVTKTETVKTSSKAVKEASMDASKMLSDSDQTVSQTLRRDQKLIDGKTESGGKNLGDPSSNTSQSVQSQVNRSHSVNTSVNEKETQNSVSASAKVLGDPSSNTSQSVQSQMNRSHSVNTSVNEKETQSSVSASAKVLGGTSKGASVQTSSMQREVSRNSSVNVKDNVTERRTSNVVPTGGSPGTLGKMSSGGKMIAGQASHMTMKSEDVITEERTTTTTTKTYQTGGSGGRGFNPQTPAGQVMNAIVNDQNNTTHAVQNNDIFQSTGSGGSPYVPSAPSGSNYSQIANDTVFVEHQTNYEYSGGGGFDGNYAGPGQIHGRRYNQSVDDDVSVDHNTQYHHFDDGGTDDYDEPKNHGRRDVKITPPDNIWSD